MLRSAELADQAVQAWLALHEAPATQRAYCKEAERLILWAIVERNRALSSLTTDDAIAYRNFLRRPTLGDKWIGPLRPRDSVEWRPFVGGLSARSSAYALSVLGALFRWLIEQRYMLANPFAGVTVRGNSGAAMLDTSRGITEGEWLLIRALADGLEWSYGWGAPAAQRLRFLLDFGYATGLRASELVGVTLGSIKTDGHDDHWLHLVGKGSKAGEVALPPLTRTALDQYLLSRGLSVTPTRWNPKNPSIGSLEQDSTDGITGARLWHVMRRFFLQAADVIKAEQPATAEKLRRASPHWMTFTRHPCLGSGRRSHKRVRQPSSRIHRDHVGYLRSDEIKRARQISAAFGARTSP